MCYAHKSLIIYNCKLSSKQTEKKLYITLIRTVITCGCENWTLSVRAVNSLLVF
jgi:hypothetical protein